jgi:hypothetical protein
MSTMKFLGCALVICFIASGGFQDCSDRFSEMVLKASCKDVFMDHFTDVYLKQGRNLPSVTDVWCITYDVLVCMNLGLLMVLFFKVVKWLTLLSCIYVEICALRVFIRENPRRNIA